jgi:hypothetical protein
VCGLQSKTPSVDGLYSTTNLTNIAHMNESSGWQKKFIFAEQRGYRVLCVDWFDVQQSKYPLYTFAFDQERYCFLEKDSSI